jgi:hypothetical protein
MSKDDGELFNYKNHLMADLPRDTPDSILRESDGGAPVDKEAIKAKMLEEAKKLRVR